MRQLSFIILVWLCAGKLYATAQADYIGSRQCAGCHQPEYQAWRGSHHDLAMQAVSDDSVLGDFDNATFEYNGVTSRFYRKDEAFWVRTDGADGKLRDYRIAYVFGVTPLQQYLIGFDDGRYQALNIAWDSRPESEGGQRWFHLHAGENVDHNDVLHWTRHAYNWNSRCADCHSTNLQKHYDPASNRYATTWSEIDVACEACHGPGSRHVQWAKTRAKSVADKGLLTDLAAVGEWRRQPGQSTAVLLSQQSRTDRQIDRCGHCHSRRSAVSNMESGEGRQAQVSDELLNSHLVSLLDPGVYHSDGQILDEVYVYGSFVQSKMYQHGVVCSDCHNPHSLRLKAPNNQLCTRCHSPAHFDTVSHHHHPQSSSGAMCVNCHMPETTYMVVDPRRDHSIRIPRPDLSQTLDVPNACIQCHDDQPNAWASQHFAKWYPERVGTPHYGEVLHQGFNGDVKGMPKLAQLASDAAQATIVRASALRLLGQYASPYAFNTALTLLDAHSPEIRRAALAVLTDLNPQQAIKNVWPLLDDPVKAVRLEAVRLILAAGGGTQISLTKEQHARFDTALKEYRQFLQVNADTPSGQLQLGVFYQMLGDTAQAIAAYRHALILEPDFLPAMINLADIHRAQHNEGKALTYLQRALAVAPDNSSVNYSLGLLHIRTGELRKALPYLRKASHGEPSVAHYSYVYAVALFEAGAADRAISLLQQTLQRHPGHREILSALVSYLRAQGRTQEAQAYAAQLQGL